MIKSIYAITIVIIAMTLIGCSTKKSAATKELNNPAEKLKTHQEVDIDFLQENNVQLAKPQLMIDSILFKKSATITIGLDLEDVIIRYTINGGTPHLYSHPIQIMETAVLTITAEKSGYKSSAISDIQIIKVPNKKINATVTLAQNPSENYPGNGAQSLMDLEQGTLNFKENNEWLGFQNDEIDVNISFNDPTRLKSLYCSLLIDHGAWIFQPKEIQIWNKGQMVGNKTFFTPIKQMDAALKIIPIDILEGTYSDLIVRIINRDSIPHWHPGAGTPPWLFIDEIIVTW